MTDLSPASHLCTHCGLCCAGAIFDYGSLGNDEIELARSVGMDVVEADSEAGFMLPCPQLDGAFCKVYQTRPQTCHTYRCETLKALDIGEIDRDTAQERVDEARAAFAQLHAQLPEGSTLTDARRWRREAAQGEAAGTLNAPPMLMMALGMLDVVIDRHFRRSDQRQVMERE